MRGLTLKNLEYWEKNIFIELHGRDEITAKLLAYKTCSNEEIIMLKERIIKLEKLIKNNEI